MSHSTTMSQKEPLPAESQTGESGGDAMGLTEADFDFSKNPPLAPDDPDGEKALSKKLRVDGTK
jgi:hypothetical protein